MSTNEFVRGSIFDRLVDMEPYKKEASPILKTLTVNELKDSVHREISWLLNTHCSYSQNEMDGVDKSTLTYGIHDFSAFFPDSNDNRNRLAKMVKDVVEAFEPRLANIDVGVVEMSAQDDSFSLTLIIEAKLKIDDINEPVTFIMAIN